MLFKPTMDWPARSPPGSICFRAFYGGEIKNNDQSFAERQILYYDNYFPKQAFSPETIDLLTL